VAGGCLDQMLHGMVETRNQQSVWSSSGCAGLCGPFAAVLRSARGTAPPHLVHLPKTHLISILMFFKRFPVVFRPPARQLERGIDDGFQNASDSLVCLQLQSIRAIAMPWKNYTKLYIFYDSSLWQSGHCHSNIGEQQEHPLDEAIKASNRRQRDLKT
jgi:hypothetical protein